MAKMDVGFIGLGQMGAPIAERLLGEDTRVNVFDVNAGAVAPLIARGAKSCASPRQVADAAEIVFACLPGRAISEAVALRDDGIIHGDAIRVYVETSTIGPTAVRHIASQLAPQQIQMVLSNQRWPLCRPRRSSKRSGKPR
jgi:3-hydroxyisobutyrate dehydrogenase-like beta-hydroxyacid dehydrogenase